MAINSEKVYWENHSYYSPNSPTKPSPVYMVAKQDGKTEIFADGQNIPGDVLEDEEFVYWHTVSGISKQAKSGGKLETIYLQFCKMNRILRLKTFQGIFDRFYLWKMIKIQVFYLKIFPVSDMMSG